jgi:1-aminocyclopropane-1-carboxylate deaminase/D-cysteine desulfhydrase-like pyridoxal-dependent ACC family enzyme
LGTFPTPVDAIDLTSVLSSFRGRAWVKREDLCSDEVGGNKVRKLEYLLAHAQKRDRRTLLTMGGIGSNHCLAAAFWGPEAGLDVELVIFPHAVSPTSRRTLRAICALGPRITYAPGATALPAVVAARWGALTARGARPYLVTPGGSTVRGTLGFVEAGLELARQVAEGALETRDTVYCAYSSGGTAAGLAVGLQLGGLRTNVVGVRVYPAPLASTRAVRWLARRTHQRIGASSAFDPSLLHAPGTHLGAGYAEPTPASSAAQEIAEDLGFTLDPTYTAKAFAAFLDAAASPGGRDAKLVFVLTYDGQSARRLADDATDPTCLPGPLRRYM